MHQSHEQRRVRKYAHARPAPDPIIVGIARSCKTSYVYLANPTVQYERQKQ